MRLPDQLRQIEPLLVMDNFGRAEIDAYGHRLGARGSLPKNGPVVIGLARSTFRRANAAGS